MRQNLSFAARKVPAFLWPLLDASLSVRRYKNHSRFLDVVFESKAYAHGPSFARAFFPADLAGLRVARGLLCRVAAQYIQVT
ncbi:protein of unknown function [Methylocella tundrae]|uniref:Uncharacterized protein n=1 Tax=Methylocella tundrae TaxID=227605 RepID=A0A4V6IN80_METTU|nr:protein of unknown function [Methylocella tundrae]